MNNLLIAAIIVIGLGIAYCFLYQYNYNEAKDAMSTMMPSNNMLAYALPIFEALEDEGYNEFVEKYIPHEYRPLIENFSDSKRDSLFVVVQMIGEDSLSDEKLLGVIKDISDDIDIPPDPEHEARVKRFNETDTKRAALPFVSAQSPVRYNTDEVNETEKPYTAPGQILIYVSAEYERQKLNMDWEPYEPTYLNETETFPNPWSGNIRFDSGSKSISYAGMGNDELIMDCPPGTPYGVIFQNDEDSGSLTVMILGSDYASYGSPLLSLNRHLHLME